MLSISKVRLLYPRVRKDALHRMLFSSTCSNCSIGQVSSPLFRSDNCNGKKQKQYRQQHNYYLQDSVLNNNVGGGRHYLSSDATTGSTTYSSEDGNDNDGLLLSPKIHQKKNKKISKGQYPKKYSLGFSSLFCVPELGMKQYEVLSRATAFLLSIDPKDAAFDEDDPFFRDDDADNILKNPYKHLETSERKREIQSRRDVRGGLSGVSNADDRRPIDFSWLEYLPREARPRVHIVTSSHVVAPYLWREYYTQSWLQSIRPHHVTYVVEIIDNSNNTVIATLPINSNPYHHPEGRDVSLLHFREEQSTLNILHQYNIKPLYLRDSTVRPLKHNESIYMDGYEVVLSPDVNPEDDIPTTFDEHCDNRIFVPHIENGTIVRNINDRIYATTNKPLTEGLCGAPVIDIEQNECCGCVEGIVPTTFDDKDNKQLAGTTAFIPNYIMKPFIDYVERYMLEQIMPNDLFKMVEQFKRTNTLDDGMFFTKNKETGQFTEKVNLPDAYNKTIAQYKQIYGEDQLNEQLKEIQEQRDAILQAYESNDNKEQDLNTFTENYINQSKANEIRQLVQMQYRKQQDKQSSSSDTKKKSKTVVKNYKKSKEEEEESSAKKQSNSSDEDDNEFDEDRTRY